MFFEKAQKTNSNKKRRKKGNEKKNLEKMHESFFS